MCGDQVNTDSFEKQVDNVLVKKFSVIDYISHCDFAESVFTKTSYNTPNHVLTFKCCTNISHNI